MAGLGPCRAASERCRPCMEMFKGATKGTSRHRHVVKAQMPSLRGPLSDHSGRAQAAGQKGALGRPAARNRRNENPHLQGGFHSKKNPPCFLHAIKKTFS